MKTDDRPGLWHHVDLGRQGYAPVLRLQQRLTQELALGLRQTPVVITVEHDPVFTLGRRGGAEYLQVAPDWLQARGIPLIPTDRGGVITYHGPGQLVAYPIFNLKWLGGSIAGLVDALEEVMIQTAAHWGVTAHRDERNRGVWVACRKLGSVGLHVRRNIVSHGLALNVAMDLEPFTWIHPCGLTGIRMTTLALESRQPLSLADAQRVLLEKLGSQLQVAWAPLPPALLNFPDASHDPA